MKEYGNRRSKEELEKVTSETNELTYKLDDQIDFKGTEEDLKQMQIYERAYIDGRPLISDEEWEILKNRFNYKESLVSTSPSGRSWVKMFSPLPSIDKACNLEELDRFLSKFDDNEIFKIECKLDGLTANVRYKKENNIYKLDCITSRGNGRYGLKLNPYALSGVKTNYPHEIEAKWVKHVLLCDNEDLPEYFELRGEAVVPKNEHTYKKYGKEAVWRSVASGIFNRKIPFNLPGVIDCIFEGKETLESLTNNENGFYVFEGRANTANGRLIASLIDENDPNKYLVGDKLRLDKDGKINIIHKNGDTWSGYDDGEELDIVFYSASIKDSNIDTDRIRDIPGVKYISDIQFSENAKKELDSNNVSLTYRETNDKNDILSAIFDFYGTNRSGKRELSRFRLRNLYEYALDGVVIKPINSDRESQGLFFRKNKNNANKIVCPKYPEDQIAVKLLSEIVKVKLDKIEYTTTTLGNVTCSGVLDKSYFTESGSWVERINLHNPAWLEANSWIKEGNEYYLCMAMDIVPVLLPLSDF